MAGGTISLDSEALAVVASKAIFDQLPDEQREKILKQAVTFLLTPDTRNRSYGVPGTTPLQDAFNTAIREAAFKAVREQVENDPDLNDAIRKLLGPLIDGALKGEAEHYNNTLADKLGEAIGSWLGDLARSQR